MTRNENQAVLPFVRTEQSEEDGCATLRRPRKGEMEILKKLMHPMIPTEVFRTYWLFACERQAIFFRRFHGQPDSWTEDRILAEHRFTNAYRAADRVSQYLLAEVQNKGKWSPADLFFRTILFKFFNRIETWQLLVARCGEPHWSGFSLERFGRVLDDAMVAGQRIYSAAYIMPSGGPNSGFKRKHRMHLALLKRMMDERLPEKIAVEKTMGGAFNLLRDYPTIGDFLAYQYVTDLNYSTLTDYEEDEFVMPGPGAREGIEKCFTNFSDRNFAYTIERVCAVQEQAFAALGVHFQDLWGRRLHLIDCQNLFCEVAKYARVRHPEFNGSSGRSRIKQKFTAQSDPIEYMFPKKYKLVVPQPNDVRYVAGI